MVTKIDSEIIGYKVKEKEVPLEKGIAVETMSETTKRPESLHGTTYKIKLPTEDSATYVTVNDIILNPGTPQQERRPYEIFINSRNVIHRPWIDTLTRVLSAVFRKGGSYEFLVGELQSIVDPNGGGWYKGRYTKSLIAEIGNVLESHIANFEVEKISEKASADNTGPVPPMEEHSIDGATKCHTCGVKAVIRKDGCPTCLACGDSKCG